MAPASAPDPGRAGTLAAVGAEGRDAGTGAVAQDELNVLARVVSEGVCGRQLQAHLHHIV